MDKSNGKSLSQPFHPDDLKRSKVNQRMTTHRSLTSGRFAITDREKIEKYYRTLGPQEIAELHKYGVDYFPASKSWRIPQDLSHLPKELVWNMLVESYNDMMRPGWRETMEHKTRKGFEWLFKLK